MPAPFRLECPHLHCTRVHNKGLQMPTSSCAKAQLKIRAPKKMPASTSSGARPKDTRVGLLACVQEMPASATSYARPRGHARRPPPAGAKDGRASMDACKDARVAPVARVVKMRGSGRLRSFDRVVVASVLPATFSP